jgi:single-stranded-DNA-specific exonuclease
VASRVQREFHRPTIVIGCDGVQWRGSGRSIEGFDIAAGLRECAHLLERHGGHAMAAGLSLSPDNLDIFRERFNDVARLKLDALSLQRMLRLDADAKLSDLSLETITALNRIGPFGNGNFQIQLLIRNARLAGEFRRMGSEQQHARFPITDDSARMDVVWFNAAELPTNRFDLAVVPQLNFFNGATRLQLKLIDVRPVT